jgi:hypothetical protein
MRWMRARRTGTSQADLVEEHRRRVAAPRAIWLPQESEPVTIVLGSGEKLPGRVFERRGETLTVAIVVPTPRLPERELALLVLEYANPGGRVRLRGAVSQKQGGEGLLLRIEEPELIEVAQDRKHVRVEAECPIALRAPESDPTHPVIITHTVDLSAGGLLLAPTEGIEADDEFEFQLAITPGTPPVTGSATIVRIDQGGRAGLFFSDISHADRWRLIRFTVDIQGLERFRHPALDEHEGLYHGLWRSEGE